MRNYVINKASSNGLAFLMPSGKEVFTLATTRLIPMLMNWITEPSVSLGTTGQGRGSVAFLLPAVRFFPAPLYYYNNEQVVSHTLFWKGRCRCKSKILHSRLSRPVKVFSKAAKAQQPKINSHASGLNWLTSLKKIKGSLPRIRSDKLLNYMV